MAAPVVILVRPQMGENIGAVARAMSNFGLSELRLAAPRDGWPNPKATEMAAGAEAIIETAKVYPDFPSAMADIQIMPLAIDLSVTVSMAWHRRATGEPAQSWFRSLLTDAAAADLSGDSAPADAMGKSLQS